MLPRKNWESAIYMAHGVTTTLDNSMWSENVFPTAEMIEAGITIGPRTFSTGDPLYAGDAERLVGKIDGQDAAKAAAKAAKAASGKSGKPKEGDKPKEPDK